MEQANANKNTEKDGLENGQKDEEDTNNSESLENTFENLEMEVSDTGRRTSIFKYYSDIIYQRTGKNHFISLYNQESLIKSD